MILVFRIINNSIIQSTYGNHHAPGPVAQSVTCLATDASLTADPGVASLIPAWSHTFVEISPPFCRIIQEGLFVNYKRKYVHEVLVNCLFKLAQEKVWLGN